MFGGFGFSQFALVAEIFEKMSKIKLLSGKRFTYSYIIVI